MGLLPRKKFDIKHFKTLKRVFTLLYFSLLVPFFLNLLLETDLKFSNTYLPVAIRGNG